MQKLITIIFTFFTVLGFSQHVKMEVLEYPKYFSEVKYATYHFVQSSYSSSRPYTLIILSIAGMPGTVQGGDGKYYFLNAKALNIWMRKTFGVSPANSKHHHFTVAQGGVNGDNFSTLIQNPDKTYMKGIYSMVSNNKNWAYGHADILRPDGTCKDKCYFNGPVEYIDIWVLD